MMDERDAIEDSSQESSTSRQARPDDAPVSPSPARPPTESGNENPGDITPAGNRLTPEELPTLQWTDIDAELAGLEFDDNDSFWELASPDLDPQAAGAFGDFQDAMTWLEEMAAGRGMPIDEMPTLVTVPPIEKPERRSSAADKQEGTPRVLSARPVSELDSDPMAWLEQLAVDQSSPLEELPSVADRLLASEIVSQTEIPPGNTIHDPVEIGQALRYLEQMAMDQGVDLAAVSVSLEWKQESLDKALVLADGMALARLVSATAEARHQSALEQEERASEESADQPDKHVVTDRREHLLDDMPADPQEALAWLGDFADAGDEVSMNVIEEADTIGPRVAKDQVEGSITGLAEPEPLAERKVHVEPDTDAAVLQEMPEDPDEAMIWMQNLASQAAGESGTADFEFGPAINQIAPPTASDTELAILKKAEQVLDEGNITEGYTIYRSLVENFEVTAELISAIERVAEEFPDSPQFLRLLGDAFMQVGQVDKAVAAYRRGFDQL